MRILVTGATGMVGAELVREAIKNKDITSITALARNKPDLQHPKLKTISHSNYLDYSGLEEVFKQADVCFWCLGISQSQVGKEEYIKITYDYTIAAAKAMQQANPGITFLFVSGGGADPTEKSRLIFARIKGRTEKALQQLNLKNLVIVRPGGIQPIHPNRNAPFLYKLLIPLFPLMTLLFPSKMINSVQLAHAMLQIAKRKENKVLYENAELKKLSESEFFEL